MKRPVKNGIILFCGLVSVTAGLLSICQPLGYLNSVKRALGLP